MVQFIRKGFAALLAAFVGVAAFAQVTTSSMAGNIKDEHGEPLTGAAVVAIHTPSGTQYAAVANVDGNYMINGMRVGGPYRVTVTFLGYQTIEYTDVTLQLAETFNLNAQLKPDTEQLESSVVIAAPTSKFTSVVKTGASTNISTSQITEMPTVSRSLTDVTKLSPYGGNGMNFSGSSGRSTNFTVDGANVNNNFGLSTSLPGGGNPISLDAIEEIQVVVSPFDVRQSNFIGGGINAITKSGTNTVKGTAYVYHQNENMHGSRIDGVDLEREKERTTTYGFTLGGPIIKNKLFFFVNAEQISRPTSVIKWKVSEDGVADEDRMISRVSRSEALAVSNFLKQEYGYDPGSFDDYGKDNSTTKLLARLDWNINRANHFALRYNYTTSNTWKYPSTSRDVSGMSFDMLSKYGLIFSNTLYNQMNDLYTISADLNSRISDNVSNQLLVTYSNIVDERGNDGGFFPFVEILAGDLGEGHEKEPYMDLGTELFTYRNKVVNTILNIKDDVTWYKGAHKITAGASFEAQMALNTYMRNGTGSYRFASLSDFLGKKKPIEFAFDWGYDGDEYPSAKVRFNQIGAYAQDEWNVNDKLKLTAGIRFDTIMFNEDDVMTNNAIKALDYNGLHVDTGLWPTTNVQISPRLGFSYDVFGDRRLKIRGGTGLFAGRLPLVFFTNMPTNAGFVKGRVKGVTDKAILNQLVDNSGKILTDRWDILAALNKYDPKTFATTRPTPETAVINPIITSEAAAVDRKFKMPQVWKSSIAVDYTLPIAFPFTVTAEYIFNKTLNGVMLQNWNIPTDNAGWTTFNGADNRHMYPSGYRYNSLDAFVLSNTNKGYGSVASVAINTEPVKGLFFTAAYTHTVSKEITGMPGSNAAAAWKYIPSVDGPNFNILHNSSYNLPDRLMASVSYTDKARNHWSLFYEGLRYAGNSFIYSNDMNGDGNAYDLIYIPLDKNEIRFIDSDSETRFWEFVDQDKYLTANKGKYAEAYAVTQPMRHTFDFRYAHDFVVKAGNTRNTLQLSLDVQNVGNLFNSRWGVSKTWNTDVPHDNNGNAKIIKYEYTDVDGVPVYSTMVGSGVKTWDFTHTLANCWYMQIGIKYMFN